MECLALSGLVYFASSAFTWLVRSMVDSPFLRPMVTQLDPRIKSGFARGWGILDTDGVGPSCGLSLPPVLRTETHLLQGGPRQVFMLDPAEVFFQTPLRPCRSFSTQGFQDFLCSFTVPKAVVLSRWEKTGHEKFFHEEPAKRLHEAGEQGGCRWIGPTPCETGSRTPWVTCPR